MIKIQNLTKIYSDGQSKVVALDNINTCIKEKEFVSLMGPSGSGKSTFLSVVGGLASPTKGKVIVDDIDIYNLKEERLADFRSTYVGFVFQQFQLVPYLSACENVMLPLAITRYPNLKQLDLAKEALMRVGLGDKLDRLPNQLSGGEQQRVAIARAIVNEPPIIFTDEPTGALDSQTGKDIMDLLKQLNEKQGLTIIMVTHDIENAKIASRILEIRDGRIEK